MIVSGDFFGKDIVVGDQIIGGEEFRGLYDWVTKALLF